MTENAIAKEIVDVAIRIHTTLGPGVLVQPEVERGRSPLASIPPLGGDFQGIRVYRSDVVF
jgi:hypothetical protein